MYDDILKLKKLNELDEELEAEELSKTSFYRPENVFDREGILNDRSHKGHEPVEE